MASNLFDLHGVPLKEAASRTWSEIRADDVFGRSAQLAYYFFLALFPFLIFVIASLSVFGSADRGRAVLFGLFARLLPRPAFQLIRDTFNEILKSGGPLKMSLGILVSVWSASMGMSAIIDTLNAAYRLKETRSLAKQYLIAIALTIAVAMLFVFSVVIVVLVDGVIAGHVFGPTAAFLWHAMEWLITLAVLFLAFAITYYFAPNGRKTPLALDLAWRHPRRRPAYHHLRWIADLSALLRHLRRNLWLTGRSDRVAPLLLSRRHGSAIRRRAEWGSGTDRPGRGSEAG
ncbi:MAG TPA: YihY/virulence factor BrkB family protein [Terriglobales bacterium]|nr:YihY/virulence factor BrkB family protein [Terriglobales bacterium]